MGIVGGEEEGVVLVDIWMPELDGLEVLRRIKTEKPEVHVIMISGHANIQNAVAATRLGAADFIEKPFSAGGLLSSLERVLAGETGGTRVSESSPAEPPRKLAARSTAVARPQSTVKHSLWITR